MSANDIPFELQVEIIKKVLPVKSLVRFRSVSKQWKSLIDSSQFIIDHSLNRTQPHHLLVCYNEDKYVSIVDDDSIFHNKFSPILPSNVKSFPRHAITLDCSNGLVCLYCFHDRRIVDGNEALVLWNPSIRKYVEIVLPHRSKTSVFGVGLCPRTSDPKIVMVSADWKPEVFTLSTGVWRSIPMNLRRRLKPFDFNHNQVVVDGVIYWVVYKFHWENVVIISFDLTSEEFGEVAWKDSLKDPSGSFIYKLNESLALIDHDNEHGLCDVWMMIKNGVYESSFKKLYTIDFETLDNSRLYNMIIGFRMNGQPIVKEEKRLYNAYWIAKLKVYEPCSKHLTDLEIDATYPLDSRFLMVTSYRESLLLLDHFTHDI